MASNMREDPIQSQRGLKCPSLRVEKCPPYVSRAGRDEGVTLPASPTALHPNVSAKESPSGHVGIDGSSGYARSDHNAPASGRLVEASTTGGGTLCTRRSAMTACRSVTSFMAFSLELSGLGAKCRVRTSQ